MVCSSFALAKDQIVVLDDGERVRYFTEEQLRDLAERIEEGELCQEALEDYGDIVEQQDSVIEEMSQQIVLLEEVADMNECDDCKCRDTFRFVEGVLIGAATMIILQEVL